MDTDSAADVAAYAMFLIWKKKADVDTNASDPHLNAFAYRIVDGLIRNSKRAERRRSKLAARLTPRGSDGEGTAADIAASVAESAEAKAILAALPPADQRLITLLMAGLPASEIAAALGISRGAAAMRLQRLRGRLEAAEHPDQLIKHEELPQ